MPKQEIDKLLDMDAAAYAALMAFSRKVALGLQQAVECQRVGMSVIGLEVPHVHVHLIPLRSMQDATFQHKEALDKEEMQALVRRIAAAIPSL